jgi:signal recognition particle subunit SRP54
VFLGTGEHFEDLEPFEAEGFVKRLLGMGDMKGLMNAVNNAMDSKQQKHMIE